MLLIFRMTAEKLTEITHGLLVCVRNVLCMSFRFDTVQGFLSFEWQSNGKVADS